MQQATGLGNAHVPLGWERRHVALVGDGGEVHTRPSRDGDTISMAGLLRAAGLDLDAAWSDSSLRHTGVTLVLTIDYSEQARNRSVTALRSRRVAVLLCGHGERRVAAASAPTA